MDKNQDCSLIVAMKDFFGMKEGQTLSEFQAEVKELSLKDKAEIKAGLETNGYKIRLAS